MKNSNHLIKTNGGVRMRRCLRCGNEMKEGYGLKIENVLSGIGQVKLSKGQGLISEDIGKIKAAVCPNCVKLVYILIN